MVNYREILRLYSLNHSQRDIALAVKSSRNTIGLTLQAAAEKGIRWPLANDVSNADLEAILFPNKYKNISMYVEPDYAYIHKELAKPGVTLSLMWEEYC